MTYYPNNPNGQATSANSTPVVLSTSQELILQTTSDKLPTAINDMPSDVTPSLPVRISPQKYNDCSFAQVGSGLLTTDFTQISIGTGMAVNQSAGNLVITTGTTVNAEFVARGIYQVNGAQTLKQITTLSQRIVNNNFFIELVDIIGDTLAYNIVNTTTVDVTKTAHGFTAQNVGQRMDLCALSSVGVPMEGVIASIPDANTIRFTVAGYPASGSGTLSLTGYNKIELLYTGTTATNATFNTRRKGWQNTAVTATINTSASGHLAAINTENGVSSLSDKTLVAGIALTDRTSWDTNTPQPDVNMFVQIRAKNGTTAPASTTTWTIGMIRVEDYIASQVSIVSTRQQSLNNSLPVRVLSAPSTAVTGTITASNTAGTAAHSAAVSGNPVYVNGKVVPSTIATVDVSLVAGDAGGLPTTTGQQLIIKENSTAELDYNFNFSTVASTVTVQPFVPASGTASVRNYIKQLAISTDALGTGGVAWILDGALTVSSIAITTGLCTTSTNHDLKIGDSVVFTALAAGTGVSTNTVYYVTSVGSATTFNFALTIGGANVVPSVAYTGTTVYRILYQQHFRATGIPQTTIITFPNPLRGIANMITNFLIPTTMTSGTIYITSTGYRGF
jgi:hypothetical protein